MKKIIVLSILGLFSFSCNNATSQPKPSSSVSSSPTPSISASPLINPSPSSSTGIANPASQYCVQNGGTIVIKTDASGNQTGMCTFNDKSECDEWSFYRGECKKGDKKSE